MFTLSNICSERAFTLIRHLGRHPRDTFYVRELSRELGLPLGPVSETLVELAGAGIIRRRERGRIVTYQARESSPLLREMKILITLFECSSLLSDLEAVSSTIILFGSCADGTDTAESEIGLCIRTDDAGVAEECIRAHTPVGGRDVAAMILTDDAFRRLSEREQAVYQQIIAGNVLYQREGGQAGRLKADQFQKPRHSSHVWTDDSYEA
ncbi:MAG: hypothetical protein D5R99_08475 [Methanocalculus sp. MSAO_Arc1]|uniref:helix-turn-helix domain-containing protein n=1 Tax=Methanocalculus TaxID=71151 RepID=UPI000FF03FA7|nr:MULTISPECIES: helix-turn-helix domain-containing protein [unclassified Methanocalculus]MCP1663135.1 DNA-binding transcriptional ArsR family regulator [Methanocalculus sp. AMF5]RQD79344.1 MAG: hypothetical protein D5R99_08475 [Methanocalculus sp. MSAO_Arc1]